MKARPKINSFLHGLASISVFQRSLSDPFGGKTDEELCREDWYAVGQDIKQAITYVEEKIQHGKHHGKANKA